MKNILPKKLVSGFTLVELLIVIGIIGALMSITIYGFSTAQKRARDAQRKSDLEQYRSSLESFANKSNGLYPSYAASTLIASANLCTDLGTPACVVDPKNGTAPYGYYYISDGSGGTTATKYALSEYLEGVSTNPYFVMCSNGNTLTKASQGALTDCP